jgi:outer membrane protein insertion porin family
MLPLLLAAAFLAADFFPLRAIHVHGNKALSEARILEVTGLKVNQIAGPPELDAAKEKLLDTGMFETIAFQLEPGSDGRCCVANFEVAEIAVLFPIQFENIPEPAADIEAYLKSTVPLYNPMLPGPERMIAFYARRVEAFLASRNHGGKVLGSLVQTGKNEYKITFRSNEALPAISGVAFSGSTIISAAKLQSAINDAAFGQPFTQDGFRLLLEKQVKPLYDALGLIRVKFSNFVTEPDPRVNGVIVHVAVKEGGEYKLEKVTITGADREYLNVASLRTGNVVNFDEIKTGFDRVLAQIRKDGYMHADGDIDRKIDDESKTVAVNFAIEKGDRYTFGKLTIDGLDLNGEPAVRKIWGIGEGKPFNPLYPQFFLDRIKENGMFDGLGETKATTDIDEKTHVVNVTLIFGAARNSRRR